MPDPLATARSWIDAFNARDLERLRALADERFEHVRLSGGVLGRHQLDELLQRHSFGVGVQFLPRRYFCRGGTVVVDAGIEWRDVDTGALTDTGERAAVVQIRDGRVLRMTLHRELIEALEGAGLNTTDEVPESTAR
jgi:hypothetical protein